MSKHYVGFAQLFFDAELGLFWKIYAESASEGRVTSGELLPCGNRVQFHINVSSALVFLWAILAAVYLSDGGETVQNELLVSAHWLLTASVG